MNIYQPSRQERTDPDWAWSRFEPDAARPWNGALVGHLHRRIAWGAAWETLQQSLASGPQAAIDRLLESTAEGQAFDRAFAEYERSAVKDLDTLAAWWLRRLIESPEPLRENMALFWHNHFAFSGRSFDDLQTLVAHLQALRRLGLGSYREVLRHFVDDPAPYVGLAAGAHRRRLPSDRFVRPLIESYTFGPGVCSPADIEAAARAWSGWFVYRERLRFIPRERDPDRKTFLGQTGNWQREDILRLILEQPAAAETLVRRLYRWLISETEDPDPALLQPLVQAFARDYQIEALVATMLRSNLFFSGAAYHQRVKSPVDFAVGLVKSLEGRVSTTLLAADVAGLGQRLGDPPTTAGWPGGRHWINSVTMTGRCNLAWALLRGEDPYGDRLQVEDLVRRHGQGGSEDGRRFLNRLLLQSDEEPAAVDPAGGNLRRAAYLLAARPEYQLA
jgi:uncharacterized protein (DUF1800 family)